jgi:hypothetical protein
VRPQIPRYGRAVAAYAFALAAITFGTLRHHEAAARADGANAKSSTMADSRWR